MEMLILAEKKEPKREGESGEPEEERWLGTRWNPAPGLQGAFYKPRSILIPLNLRDAHELESTLRWPSRSSSVPHRAFVLILYKYEEKIP